jgi:hypothetical protein
MPPKRRQTDRGARGRPSSRHVEPRESFHLPQPLLDALVRYVEQTRPETSKSAVIRLALEEFLQRAGFWPPREKGGKP